MNPVIKITEHAEWNSFWNQVIYWPLVLVTIASILFIIWLLFYRAESFFGLTTKNFKWKPYLIMLNIMIPLIFLASTQPDFLWKYPKLDNIKNELATVENKWLNKLLCELTYGSDFISVEHFFSGFLNLGFIKIAGKDAILPMACFYCTIHFGKPLGECISSYFGGMFLCIIVFHTRSIMGGLTVHLGIAWLMELGAQSGKSFFIKFS